MSDQSPVLVLQLARFGDVIQTRRLIATLLAHGHAVHLLVDQSLAPLVRLAHPECQAHGLPLHGPRDDAATLRALLRCCDALRPIAFQTIYALNFSPLTEALAAAFPAARTHGYAWRNGQILRDPWLTLAFRWSSRRVYAPCNLADVWAHLHPDPIDSKQVNPSASPKGGGLGVVMAGRHARRSLPPEVLSACVAAMVQRLGKQSTTITLLGGGAEAGAARALKDALPRAMRDAVRDLTGQTDWTGLHDAVAGLDRILTPDTGTMHLAARLGVPVTATFLSSAWAWETGPYGDGHEVWQAVTDDTPCVESQSCPCVDKGAQACRAPFQDRAFLRLLSLGKGEPPAHLLRLASQCDALGCDFVATAGTDPHAAARRQWRRVIMADRGLLDPYEAPGYGEKNNRDDEEILASQLAPLADWLYHDSDWAVRAQSMMEAT